MFDFLKSKNKCRLLEGLDLTNPEVLFLLGEQGSDEELRALFKQGIQEHLLTKAQQEHFYELALRNPQSKTCFSSLLTPRKGGGTEENLGLNPIFLGEALGSVFEDGRHTNQITEIIKNIFEHYRKHKSSFGAFVLRHVCKGGLRQAKSLHLAQTMIDCDKSKLLRIVFWDGSMPTEWGEASGNTCSFVLENPDYFKLAPKDKHWLFLLSMLYRTKDLRQDDLNDQKRRWGGLTSLEREKSIKKLALIVRDEVEEKGKPFLENFCLDNIVFELNTGEILLLGENITEANFDVLTHSSSFFEYFYSLKDRNNLLRQLGASGCQKNKAQPVSSQKRKM